MCQPRSRTGASRRHHPVAPLQRLLGVAQVEPRVDERAFGQPAGVDTLLLTSSHGSSSDLDAFLQVASHEMPIAHDRQHGGIPRVRGSPLHSDGRRRPRCKLVADPSECELPQRGGDPKCSIDVATANRVAECQAQVVEVPLDVLRPVGFIRPGHPDAGSLRKVGEPEEMPLSDDLDRSLIGQLLAGVLPQRLQ